MKPILIDKFVKVSLEEIVKASSLTNYMQRFDEIKVSEVPKPQPKEGEVLVKIAAAGVNFVDLFYVGLSSKDFDVISQTLSQAFNLPSFIPKLVPIS